MFKFLPYIFENSLSYYISNGSNHHCKSFVLKNKNNIQILTLNICNFSLLISIFIILKIIT